MEGFGEKIAYFRKSKGISIKVLAEDLCDESTIYRLEKGKQLPRLEILNDICMKLEIPFKALFPFNEEIEELKELCRESTYAEDYLTLELTLEESEMVLEKLTSKYSKIEFSRFIKWHRAILFHKKEKNYFEALSILDGLASIETCGSELDISILNSKGLVYLSANNLNAAFKTYKIIFKKIKARKIVEDLTLLPRVGYNFAFTMSKLKNYEDALNIANEILYFVESRHLSYMLGEIYHMIGILSMRMERLQDAREAINNAILVFTLTKNHHNLERANNDLLKLKSN